MPCRSLALALVLVACNSTPEGSAGQPAEVERSAPLKEGVKTVEFSVEIAAPVETVWARMFSLDGYGQWTAAFGSGNYFEGTLEQGQRMRFLGPGGNGMIAEVEQIQEHRFVSFKHLGYVFSGEVDTTSDSVTSWAPAYEIYRFESVPSGTRVVIEQDVLTNAEEFMGQAWSKALEDLKALCEAG